MDARVNVSTALGLSDGDAHIIRNAGGVITEDVIRSLVISQRLLGTREIMLIHHTDCGMENLSEDHFRDELTSHAGVRPDFSIGSFADVETAVQSAVRAVRACRFLSDASSVRGFIYDVPTHAIVEIDVARRTPARHRATT
ncbi:MAG: carbonic anhydrase [Gaiellaceae bacterium]|nr:carbonic anhydrase [Gaiellaceae bacterium]